MVVWVGREKKSKSIAVIKKLIRLKEVKTAQPV